MEGNNVEINAANAVAVGLLHVQQMIQADEEDVEAFMMAVARIAAFELMQAEEGPGLFGLEDLDGTHWVYITVNINEYHLLGDPCFKLHFRMNRTIFEALVVTVRNHLIQKGRLQRERTPVQDILLMVLWLLATPDCFRSVALRFGVNPGTLYYFYGYIIEALRELKSTFITWPTAEERQAISQAFEQATGFAGIIGCIDCTHIHITAPMEDADQYVNRHHGHSVNVQTVADNNLLVRDISVGEVGSMNDKRVFRRSDLYRDLLLKPPGEMLSADEHLVGDGAYDQTDFMMVPFANNGHLTAAQLNFNRKLSQGRVRVENAYALAKGKWRRLKFMHVRRQDILVDHITACFVLHNFIILHGEPMIDENDLQIPINNAQVLGNQNLEDAGDDADDDEEGPHPQLQPLYAAAMERGIEKRFHYMDNVLPQ